MEAKCLKHHIGLTIDAKLLKKIENIRGREKRRPLHRTLNPTWT